MTSAEFAKEVSAIRSALQQTQSHLLDDQPINIIPLRDMIDSLTQNIGKQAGHLDQTFRDTLASDLNSLVSELETLEQLVEKRLAEDKN